MAGKPDIEIIQLLDAHYVDNHARYDLFTSESELHDCRNPNACGLSITSYKIDNHNIHFYGNSGKEISSIPKIQSSYAVHKYHNNLYQSSESRNFDKVPVQVRDVLPYHFILKYKGIDFIVNYDNLTATEKEQTKKDIQNAYEIFKEKFCIDNTIKCISDKDSEYYKIYDGKLCVKDTTTCMDPEGFIQDNGKFCEPREVKVYIFNNKIDYSKYGTLLGFSKKGLDTSLGISLGKKILCYKYNDMDSTLAHELGHVFQGNFAAGKVKELDNDPNIPVLEDDGSKFDASEFIANVIGQEVGKKNHDSLIEDSSNRMNTNSGTENNFIIEILCCFIGLIALFFWWKTSSDDGSAPHHEDQQLSLLSNESYDKSYSDDII
ncbi:hypothetical protein BIY23_04530 [Wolbachia pipientis]|uniref:Uncharacterized protein n=1 Tax=Wolbachia pipientis TaxID=955 RepID=A0A1E7QKX3_WOLPI|nr:hypothetical protein [Wolbachia pipientis]OEY86864.1 hypothetical protein BIY23_04530 [Wolbachia pipientis]